jgi:hypothetical protein
MKAGTAGVIQKKDKLIGPSMACNVSFSLLFFDNAGE